MATAWRRVGGEVVPTLRWRRLRRAVQWLGLAGLLVLVCLTQAPSPPVSVGGWQLAILFVAYGLAVVGLDAVDGNAHFPSLAVVGLSGLVLIGVLYRYRADAFPAGEPSSLLLVIVALLLTGFGLGDLEADAVSRVQWALVGGFGAVIGLVLVHTLPDPRYVGSPTWPIWAAVVATVCVLVLPRFVPEDVFLWAVAAVSAGTGVLGIAAMGLGYTPSMFEVGVIPQDVPFTTWNAPWWQGTSSIFNNVNVFGLVSFAGVVASVVLLHRARRAVGALVAAVLVAVTAVGVIISSSDVSWIVAGVSLGVYGSYLAFGRRALLPTVVGGLAISVLAVVAVYVGYLPVDDSGRFVRWGSAIEAFRADPAVLGHGYISTSEFAAPFRGMGSGSPHNSYLSVLIRFGVLGVLGYLLFLGGVLARGLVRRQVVSVAMLAFALGWAFHHMFEAYTIVQFTAPAVLSASAFGYLLFDGPARADSDFARDV